MLPFAIALVATAEWSKPQPPPDAFDETAVAAAVWRASPDVVAARAAILDAEAAAGRAALYPNPSLIAAWGTVPVGKRPGSVAFSQVPSYTVGASQLFELGKRGPRRQAAREGLVEAGLTVRYLYRQRFLDVLRAVGEQATAAGRASVLERLVQSGAETLRLQRLRAERGDVAGLEVDRLEVEHLRLLSSLGSARAAAESAAAGCALLLGQACPRFEKLEAALGYLATPAGVTGDDQRAIANRPDLQALEAAERRARAEQVLAQRRVIPDPTVSASFTRDAFVSAGNQPDSVTLSLGLPLPLFDRGQPEAARAAAHAALAHRQREALTEASQRALAADRRRVAILIERARRLDEQAIPMARTTAERLEAAARRGGAALQDVLLARRAMEELQLDRVDVAGEAFAANMEIRRAAGSVPEPPGAPR